MTTNFVSSLQKSSPDHSGWMDQELLLRSKQFDEKSKELATRARAAFRIIRTAACNKRNLALSILRDRLQSKNIQEAILKANQIDLENGKTLSASMLERLALDEKKLNGLAASLNEIINFTDPVGEVVSGYTLRSGVRMIKKRVPLGIIFTVYESRPNVTIDVGALCLKSGNVSILRGGKEAYHSNMELIKVFRSSIEEAGLPSDSVLFVDETDRALIHSLLQREELIDLVVPRGGESLIRFVVEHSRIPVVKHDKGVCTLFVDKTADFDMALMVAKNAKLQRPSVCNAIENLLIHADFPDPQALLGSLKEAGAELLGCERTVALFPSAKKIEDPDSIYGMEFLDNRLSVKIVDTMEDAVLFIHRYSSGHSEGIIATDEFTIESFVASVDSAGVFINCSTRFHDGGEMGMGAEVGISTGRMHVRGPMGLRDLTTTTYILRGEGQIRS